MPVDIVQNTCSCEWCSIRRDLGKADSADRGWHWARLWRHYLKTVLDSLDAIEKGQRIAQVTIDETREIANEGDAEFTSELAAALEKGEVDDATA